MIDQKKHLLTIEKQIEHLKSKGITFDLVSEKDAFSYLQNESHFFKLIAYRKNYQKYEYGDHAGQYIHLEFGDLEDLTEIDRFLRSVLLQLSLDVEYYAKMKILKVIEEHHEDGYQIVVDFMDYLKDVNKYGKVNEFERCKNDLERNRTSPYCGELVKKYSSNYPVWVFLEIVPFGRTISFYKFCGDRYHDREMIREHYLLKTCKDIRNAAAHNNCILNDLHLYTAHFPVNYMVAQELCQIPTISKSSRNKRMSNIRLQQIVSLLYMHNKIVTSEKVHQAASLLLHALDQRFFIHDYHNNSLIYESFVFLHKIIDCWF